MSVEFPIFVFAKDGAEVFRFDSIHEMQKQLEKIDVENAEYLAWESSGNPVSLTVQRPVWLKVEAGASVPQSDLKSCLEKYATVANRRFYRSAVPLQP